MKLSNFNKKTGKTSFSRSFYIKILILLILIGMSAIALKPVQVLISGSISNIRSNLIGRLEIYTGMEIRYSSIRPSFFTSFDIRNVGFYKEGNEVLTILRARIYFSLRELFFRKKTIIHTIQIDSPVLRLDTKKDKDTFELIKSFSSPSNADKFPLQQITEFLPDKTNYRIRNFLFSLTDGDSLFLADNMNVNIARDKNEIQLDILFDLEIIYSELFGRMFMLNTKLNINGAYFTDLQECKGLLAFSPLTLQEQSLKTGKELFLSSIFPSTSNLVSSENTVAKKLLTINPFAVNFSYEEKAVSLFTLEKDNKSNYSFSYYIEEKELDADFNLNDFIVNSVLKLNDNPKEIAYLLDIPVTGRLSINYKNFNDLYYNVFLQSGRIVRMWQENLSLSDAFIINAYGSNERVTVNDFCINTSVELSQSGLFQGIVSYKGSIDFFPLKPSGIISVNHLTFTGKDSLDGDFTLSGYGKDIFIKGKNISVGSYSPQTLDINLSPSGRDIDITVSCLGNGGDELFLNAIMTANPALLEGSLSLHSFDIANIAESLKPFVNFKNIPVTFIDNTLLDVDIFISSDFKNYAYNASSIVRKNDTIKGRFFLSGTDRNFSLTEGIFYLEENELSVSANADFSNLSDFDFMLNARYIDISWNITGRILDGTTFIMQDTNGLYVYGNRSGSGAVSGYVEGINFPIPANVRPAYIDFYVTLRYNSRDFWSVNVSQFKIRDLHSNNGLVNLSLSGSADQDGASFRDILFNDNIGSLAGNADFLWNTDFSFLHFTANMTDGIALGENYSLEGLYIDNTFNLNMSVSDIRVDRFVKRNGVMLASAQVKVSWDSIDSFNSEINLLSFIAGTRTKPLNTSVDIYITNNELLAENLAINYSNIQTIFSSIYISLEEGIARINTGIRGAANRKNIKGDISLEAGFDSVDTWLNIRQALSSINGSLQIDNFQFGNLLQDKTNFIFSSDDGAVSISGGIRDMLKVELDKKNNIYVSLSDPLPIIGSFAGEFKNFNFNVYTNDYYIDLASLWDISSPPQENFNITGGYVTGKMNLKGTVLYPEFYGTGKCTSLRLQVPGYMTEDIRVVPFDIIAEGYEMTFGPVTTLSGSGGGNAAGWFLFENWVPKNIGLDITVPRETPVPYNLIVAGFHANGDVSGKLDMSLAVNDRIMELKGDLYMNNTEMVHFGTSETADSNEFDSDESFNTVVELAINTGPMVEFFWPNINNPILRVSPEIRTIMMIYYDSLTGQYSINSDIKIRSGEMYYLDRNFRIREGNLLLMENESQFNPMLNVRAELRERSDSGPVTISMIVENQQLLSFVPRFEANPGLTQLEIYTILGQNLNVQDNENPDLAQRFLLMTSTDLLAQIVSGSEVLSQLNFVRQIERGVRTFLHLDMLSIRTRLLQNTIVSGVNVLGMSSVDSMGRVGNYFDNTTVFIGKYIGQYMFIQSTLAIKYDENRTQFGGIRLEPDIGVELQSPFINIRWDFFPNNPKNWWMNDHSISLIWSKSFK